MLISFSTTSQAQNGSYLFCSFRGNGDGLHLAASSDGLHWAALNNDQPYLKPTIGGRLMRDPCILQGPDGEFHLVWTTGWWDKVIGYASSKDLIHWTEQKAIPVMEHEPTAKNSWAPEVAYDPATAEFMIYFATTIPGRFKEGEEAGDKAQDGTMLNHRIYATTTKDFNSFTPTKLLFNPGYSVIDSTIRKNGDTFFMIFKDETKTPPKKHLRVASSKNLQGPYEVISEPFTPAGAWVEGPSITKVGDDFIVYFDMYMAHKYGAMKSKDFKSWTDITDQLSFNVQDVRHGTAFQVSREVMAGVTSAPTAEPGQNP
jgi:beta-xylosidase